ncbi:MAG TPA: response regulator [Chloroflexota bacterium]|nr:response regulator [Chloroflexota bacterium]
MSDELILIVEDNEKNMKLVRDLLQYKGYRTLEAPTAGEALNMAAQHRPDLVLMDIQLPDMDGITALKRLQADPATAGLTVVAVTAQAMKEDAERIMGAGFSGYLTKPIDIRTFPDEVRRFCEGAS